MKEEANPFAERTSRLVRGLALATARQAEKIYRGRSRDEAVSARVSGRHELLELKLDSEILGIPDKKAGQIEESVREAVNRAIHNAQNASRRAIREGLDANRAAPEKNPGGK